MRVIMTRNVHQALPEAVYQLAMYHDLRNTRNGPALVFSEPVTTCYVKPKERVMFWKERDANPFFHLMESLWMLGGRNDVEYPASFVPRMRNYSDDGVTFHGAYGHRWRVFFGVDQIFVIAKRLKENPDDRRCVLQIWDASIDLDRSGNDVPCNTQAYFSRNAQGALDMTICNRSNDLIWGCYGTNAVHFSMLQEVLAAAIGCEVGRYWQMSNNLHAYKDKFDGVQEIGLFAKDPFLPHPHRAACPYELGEVSPFPVVSTPIAEWFQDLEMFLDQGAAVIGLRDRFFRHVAVPMFTSHRLYKAGDKESAIEALKSCHATDWRLAGEQWLQRRVKGAARKEIATDDGVFYDEQQ